MLAADSDMLAAYNWNRGAVFNGSGSYDLVPFNNNLDFIIRAADYLTDNQKILNVPPKGGFELQKSPEQTLNEETGASLADQIELYSLSMSQALYEQEQLKQKIKRSGGLSLRRRNQANGAVAAGSYVKPGKTKGCRVSASRTGKQSDENDYNRQHACFSAFAAVCNLECQLRFAAADSPTG